MAGLKRSASFFVVANAQDCYYLFLMRSDKFNVRLLGEQDLNEWLRLRKLLWDAASEDDHRSEMLDIIEHPESQVVLVAENGNGRLVGFLEAGIRPFAEDCTTDQVGYLEGWFVETPFRRIGIGTALVRGAEQWAISKGCSEMASDAEVGNDASLAAHLNLDYEVSSRLIHLRKNLV
ncbi:MAG TPA: aminoglycoside 6'-acetyltransferase [Blastocatellia bacterium]|nr:aminoglycoside 6'-acetyltransferase [Blastocatellia bacterium]